MRMKKLKMTNVLHHRNTNLFEDMKEKRRQSTNDSIVE
jgi:hypothetical protein